MKTISPELASHLAQETTTLAQCWKLTRRDGIVMGFTDHDQDIEYDALSYIASSGLTSSAIASQSSLAVDNLDIEGILHADMISESDILAGLYDYAEVETFILNYTDISQGRLQLRYGWLGEIQLDRGQFVAELRGLTQKLAQHVGELYSPICRTQLGDARCGVDVSAYQVTGSVSALSGNGVIDVSRTEETSFFNGGMLTFTSGKNQQLVREVKFFFAGGEMQMALPFPYEIEVGDTYELIPGCNKTITTCIARYDNAINFRGEPHVPGVDQLLQTATTQTAS